MKFLTVNTRRGNCIYENNAIVSKEDYTNEDWSKFLAGEEIPCEWDENDEPIAWDFVTND